VKLAKPRLGPPLLQLAENHLTLTLFEQILGCIERLTRNPT